MKAKVLMAVENNHYYVKVEGRATFESSTSLRNLALKLQNTPISGVTVNLRQCTGLDSTFIGILAMLGLSAKKSNAPAVILNADDNIKKLLDGLGLYKIFSYQEGDDTNIQNWNDTSPAVKTPPIETAKTVLHAHETLMEIDQANIPRFQNVVEFVRKDLEKNKDSN